LGSSRLRLLVVLGAIVALSLVTTSLAGAEGDAVDDMTYDDSIVAITLPSRAAIDDLIALDVDLVEYVRENDDGTITVTPSPVMPFSSAGERWHGWLRRGVFEDGTWERQAA